MAVKTIFVQPDPFLGNADDVASFIPSYNIYGGAVDRPLVASDKVTGNEFDYSSAARPIHGIVVRPNTQAFVQVMRADGAVLKVFNQLTSTANTLPGIQSAAYLAGAAGAGGIEPAASAWTDWLLQAVREERMEKTQIVETFGETYLYAFGEKPRSLVFSGLLMNTTDFNWRGIFWENWDKYFRATKLIESNARIYIGFDDIIVEGYPLNAVASQTADSPNAMSFTFSFFVTNYTNISAQRGHLTRDIDPLDIVRAGYDLGTKTLSSSRMTLLERLGLSALGPSALGTSAYNSISLNGTINQTAAALAGRTVGAAAKLAADVAYSRVTGEVNMRSFVNSFVAATAIDVFRTAASSATDSIEDKNNLKRGEVNAWFGNMAALLSVHLPLTTKETLESTGGLFLDALRSGSVERMVQAMGYSIGAAAASVGKGGPRPGAMTTVKAPS